MRTNLPRSFASGCLLGLLVGTQLSVSADRGKEDAGPDPGIYEDIQQAPAPEPGIYETPAPEPGIYEDLPKSPAIPDPGADETYEDVPEGVDAPEPGIYEDPLDTVPEPGRRGDVPSLDIDRKPIPDPGYYEESRVPTAPGRTE